MTATPREWHWTLSAPAVAVDWMASQTGLPKSRLKDAMNKGAVTLKRGRKGVRRLRRATFRLLPGDVLSLYYDASILAARPETEPEILGVHCGQVQVFKPSGWLSQGSPWGDHLSLERWLTQHGFPDARVVHRLDRETAGVMVFARTRHAAATLGRLFQSRDVTKVYRACVRGTLAETMTLDLPLDGKPARSHVAPLRPSGHDTLVRVEIETGRFHQVRRHLESAGHPVLGDPRYGEDNAHPDGLMLLAWALTYRCPECGARQSLTIPQSRQPGWSCDDPETGP